MSDKGTPQNEPKDDKGTPQDGTDTSKGTQDGGAKSSDAVAKKLAELEQRFAKKEKNADKYVQQEKAKLLEKDKQLDAMLEKYERKLQQEEMDLDDDYSNEKSNPKLDKLSEDMNMIKEFISKNEQESLYRKHDIKPEEAEDLEAEMAKGTPFESALRLVRQEAEALEAIKSIKKELGIESADDEEDPPAPANDGEKSSKGKSKQSEDAELKKASEEVRKEWAQHYAHSKER